jgi:hypothetical protein
MLSRGCNNQVLSISVSFIFFFIVFATVNSSRRTLILCIYRILLYWPVCAMLFIKTLEIRSMASTMMVPANLFYTRENFEIFTKIRIISFLSGPV